MFGKCYGAATDSYGAYPDTLRQATKSMRTMRFSYASLLLTCLSWVEALRPLPYDAQIDNGKQGSYPLLPNFATSEVRAPRINFETWSPECDDGRYYFVTPRGWKVNKPGPMILDAAGNLIWSKHFDNEFGGQAYDFKVQSYRGEQVLTFWLGDDTVRGWFAPKTCFGALI